jgi:Ca2+-binding RTX toxin-like protein
MINFARLLLAPGQSASLSGIFETDWNYGRAIHFLAPSAISQQDWHSSGTDAAPTLLQLKGVVSAADTVISADWRFVLYNQGTITNRYFLTMVEAGYATDERYAITGSSYADEVHNAGRIEGAVLMGAGNDMFDGQGGQILGPAYGDDGDDTLLSGAAAETLLGGEGQDWLCGGDGADSLSGGIGANRMLGGTGNDSVTSEDGDDFLAGEAGDDWLLSDRGNDSLSGGDGADTLIGGDGNDTITVWGGGDCLLGDAGNDFIDVIGGAFTLSGGMGSDTLTVFATWIANDLLDGGEGADSLNGGAGDDTLIGGGGADTLMGGGGTDASIGGEGDDVILAGTTTFQDIMSLFAL